MSVVKLLGAWMSPYCYKVIWALKLKGIPYEYIEEDLSNKSPLLLQYNPLHKKVPVLIHDGKSISESTIILQYIEDTWPQNPLLPTDPYDRSVALFWIKFTDERNLSIAKLYRTYGEEQEKAAKDVLGMLEAIEERALTEGNKFFAGEEISMVDIAFCFIAHWLGVIEEAAGFKIYEPNKFPRLNSWIQNFIQVPVIKQNLPDPQRISALLRARKEMLLASKSIGFGLMRS